MSRDKNYIYVGKDIRINTCCIISGIMFIATQTEPVWNGKCWKVKNPSRRLSMWWISNGEYIYDDEMILKALFGSWEPEPGELYLIEGV